MKTKKHLGFTLIELIIVFGIFAILITIAIVAINPFEQINKAIDVANQAISRDFKTANDYYFANKQSVPWSNDDSCKEELTTGKTIKDIPSCVRQLAQGDKLETSVLSSQASKDIYVTQCSNSLAICYHPKSQSFNQKSEVKYTQNGALNPNCQNNNKPSNECYACTFTTKKANECFQALNPNGSLAIAPSPLPNQLLPIPSRHSKNTCSDPAAEGLMSCMAKVVTDSDGTPLSSLAPPGGLGPAQLHTAYNLPCKPGGPVQTICAQPATFGPQIIAIVDAFGAPTLENDLAVYNQTYNLPPCTKANGCLTIVNQNGQASPLPPVKEDWALETALDVQMAHAVCQTCKILVVLANSNSITELGLAVNRAAAMGAKAISNSYGANEWAGETTWDTYYNHPGVFVTAASGDWGYKTSFPAASKHVIAVGGTTLSLYANNTYHTEYVWGGAGSGCSLYESANSFQLSVANWSATGCNTKRGIADVSAVADPNTGVAVYNSTPYSGYSGWWVLGGTSVSSPIISAIFAMTATIQPTDIAAIYAYNNPSKFRDVTSGWNGICNTTMCTGSIGYDGPTGLGSPNPFGTPSPTPVPNATATPTPTRTPSPTPTLTPVPGQPQAWVATNAYIHRFNFDGTSAGAPITSQAYYSPSGIATVGQQVWTANMQFDGSLSRFDFSGKFIGPQIIGNGLHQPKHLAVVGNQVWVTNTDGDHPTNNISRFNFDGTSAGSPITGNGMCDPAYLAVVGNQVWVGNINYSCRTQTIGTISRFNFDGTSAGSPLTGNNLSNVQGIAVVGTKVWVANYFNNNISLFNFDGTSAGTATKIQGKTVYSTISGNGLDHPYFIGVVGNQVWVGNGYGYTISRFNFDGTSAGSPIQLNGIIIPYNITIVPQN